MIAQRYRMGAARALALAAVLAGCAQPNGAGAPPSRQQIDPQTGQPYTSASGVPSAHLAALLTTIQGTLYVNSTAQPFSATLSTQVYNGATYAYVNMNSTGSAGVIQLSEYLGTGANGVYDPYSGGYIYTFGTRIFPFPLTSVSSSNTMLYFYLVITPSGMGGGSTFSINRTRSGIYFLDCGNSQTNCSIFNSIQGLQFTL